MNMLPGNQSYYELLEIPQDAPQHVITEAYKRAKATYSPNSPALYTMFTVEEADALLKMIEEAYRTLSNYSARQEYDRRISGANAANSSNLPDFEVEDLRAGPSPSYTPEHNHRVEPSITTEIPEGFSKTKFGVYEINEGIEEQIQNCVEMSGTFLKEVRVYKKITLDQMSKETKISQSYLVAIESNDYDALPARVFVRGFVIQMAKVLGIDEQISANSYVDLLMRATVDK